LINNYKSHYEDYLDSFYTDESRANREYSEEFLEAFNEMMEFCYTDSDANEYTFASKFDEIANEYLDQLKMDFQTLTGWIGDSIQVQIDGKVVS
jgi:16S rRNA C1402 N4-methylase RsmH